MGVGDPCPTLFTLISILGSPLLSSSPTVTSPKDNSVPSAGGDSWDGCWFYRRNCRGNPNCLVGIGEHVWLGEIDENSFHNIDDPNCERRKKVDHPPAPSKALSSPWGKMGTRAGDTSCPPVAREFGMWLFVRCRSGVFLTNSREAAAPTVGFLLAPLQRRVTTVAFSLTPERVRGLNEPRRHVLRQHFLADVVS